MNVHEAFHYQTPDSQSPLPPEVSDARQHIARLVTDLNLLALRRFEEAPTDAGNFVAPEALDPEEEEAYIDPEVRRRHEFGDWVADCVKTYEDEMAGLSTLQAGTKRRNKQESLALSRFLTPFRHVENDFTIGPANIIYNLPALEVTLDELGDDDTGNNDLYNALIDQTVEYCSQHAGEVMSVAPVLANLIRLSTSEDHVGEVCNELLQTMFEQAGTRNLSAVDAMTHLASATLELLQNPDYLRKALDIYYFRTNIIPDPAAFAKARLEEVYVAAFNDDHALTAQHLQNVAALFQARLLLLNEYEDDPSHIIDAAGGLPGISALLSNKGHFPDDETFQTKMDKAERWAAIEERILDYDPIEVVTVGASAPVSWQRKRLPSEIAALTYNLPLYKKRLKTVAPPYALIQLSVLAGIANNLPQDDTLGVSDHNISPGATISVYEFLPPGSEQSRTTPQAAYAFWEAMNSLLAEDIRPTVSVDTAEPYMKFVVGAYHVKGGHPDRPLITIARPATPNDRKWFKRDDELRLSIASLMRSGQWNIPMEQVARLKQEQLERLSKGNRFPGQRWIKFKLPKSWQHSEMRSISVKQDIDKRYLLARVDHKLGPVDLVLNKDFRIVAGEDRHPVEVKHNVHVPDIELLILKLVTDYACAPVIHTSEGTLVQGEREASNSPYFMYLGVIQGKKRNFQARQAAIFARDRTPVTGTTLLYESLRRRLTDETGQQRNSTWVADRFDPRTPPLIVYPSDKSLRVS